MGVLRPEDIQGEWPSGDDIQEAHACPYGDGKFKDLGYPFPLVMNEDTFPPTSLPIQFKIVM